MRLRCSRWQCDTTEQLLTHTALVISRILTCYLLTIGKYR